jgi:two-component system chemotaxis sensor kinase CheA
MTIDMSQFYQVFFEETGEHLGTMENLLLKLDVSSPDLDDLNAIFRAAHSIKGGSGTFGFTDMTEVTHELESLLDKLRKNELNLREDMVDAFLAAGDILKAQLDAHQNGGEVDEASVNDICNRLKRLASQEAGTANASPAAGKAASATQSYLIVFPQTALSSPEKGIDNFVASLGELGTVQVLPPAKGKKNVTQLSFNGSASKEQILELFDFVGNPKKVRIEIDTTGEETTTATESDADPGYGFFTDVEPATTAQDEGYGFFVEPAELKTQVEEAQGYGFFTDPPASAPATVTPVLGRRAIDNPDTPVAKAGRREADKVTVSTQSDTSSIRVSVEKVDQLINLVGELVITQAMLAQTASQVDPVIYEKLLNGMAQLERNTRDLQESVMSIRMMPIGFVFSRFPRVVRDLAGKLNKQVELKTVGEATELDKGLIEKISDPLTHLVRNSLDHGIELPETRIAADKDPKGTITLRASHQGGNIIIEVLDDGGGLSREKILAKAAERQINISENPSNHEVWQLIFAPGFSTAAVVTDVSGRGVGMDVVKRNIEGMGGRVEIDSNEGYGTKITIRLPLTLAILDGMSVAVGDEIFIFPLAIIIESLQPPKEDIKTVSGEGRVVHVRGEYLPLIALHEVFHIQPKMTEPEQGILVIIESDGKKAALFVDELVGQHQVVIKSLESNYRRVDGVSGATIMGDGKVALILDVPALVRISQS